MRMIPCTRLIVLLTCFVLVSPAKANEEAKAWLQFFTGGWKRERETWTEKEGTTKEIATWSCQPAAGGRKTVSKLKWEHGPEWMVVSGWDDTHLHVEHGVTSDGNNWSIHFKPDGADTLKGTATADIDGESVTATVIVTKTGEDSYTGEVEVKNAEGKVVAKSTAKNTRLRKPDVQAIDLERDFGWLIGTWESEFTLVRDFESLGLKKGDTAQEKETFRWGLDKKFLIQERTIIANGKAVASLTDFIGYDPESKRIKQWGFYSTGGHGSGLWSRVGADALALTWSTIDPDGNRGSGKSIRRKIDDDRFENQTIDRYHNGEKLPQGEKTVSRRTNGGS